MSDEFYDFEKALNELKMEEEELKRLVSAGEIRAFRSKGQMKFRKEDIDKLRSGDGASLEETEGEDTLTDDLVFDEGDQLSLEDEEEGMATAKIDEQDTLIDAELPDIESDISDLESEEPLSPRRPSTVSSVSKRGTRVTRLREAQEARKAANPVFFAMVILSTVLMLYGIVFLVNYANSQNNGMTEGVSTFMVDNFTDGASK